MDVAKGDNSSNSDSNSDYDSFHSDEVEATSNTKEAAFPPPEPKKKDWAARNKLSSIREERSDSILSLGNNDDEHTEIIRAAVLGSAVAAS